MAPVCHTPLQHTSISRSATNSGTDRKEKKAGNERKQGNSKDMKNERKKRKNEV
jgi:hypothetical protein